MAVYQEIVTSFRSRKPSGLYRVISPHFVRPREVQLECAKTYRHNSACGTVGGTC